MNEKKAKAERRVKALFQAALKLQGTTDRVMAAYEELKGPLLQAELRERAGASLKDVARHARDLLAERGLDLKGVQIVADRTPTGYRLRADADEAAIEEARRLSKSLQQRAA